MPLVVTVGVDVTVIVIFSPLPFRCRYGFRSRYGYRGLWRRPPPSGANRGSLRGSRVRAGLARGGRERGASEQGARQETGGRIRLQAERGGMV